MFNPIIVPLRNNLHLTRKAVASFLAQDIDDGVYVLAINNASSDGTSQWLQTERRVAQMYFDPPLSVAESWNRGLEHVFKLGAEYALVCNNDVELRPDTYRLLVQDGGGFVTAVGTRDAKKIEPMHNMIAARLKTRQCSMGQPVQLDDIIDIRDTYSIPDPSAKRPHPDFSCYLIRRNVYETVGAFDENFKIAFVEDGDYDLRMYRAGIRAYCIDLPFLHHGSMTIKNAEPAEIKRIQVQADKNREYFRRKHGFAMASEEYYRALGKGGPDVASTESV